MSDQSQVLEIIRSGEVCLGLDDATGVEVIATMLEQAADRGLFNPEVLPKVLRAVLNRERSASTATPEGVAFPHCRSLYIDKRCCVIGVHPKGIPFGASNGAPTTIFVLMLVPQEAPCVHVQLLTRLSRSLLEPAVRNEILAATAPDQVIDTLLKHAEEDN